MRPGAGCHLRGETLAGCRLLSDAGWVERARGVTYVVKRWSGATYVVALSGRKEATNEVVRWGAEWVKRQPTRLRGVESPTR